MDSGIPIEAWAFYRDGVDFESRTASGKIFTLVLSCSLKISRNITTTLHYSKSMAIWLGF